ncbi:MAG: ANTAR domain-containing response regulator [Gammaproteobacteria bacterium]
MNQQTPLAQTDPAAAVAARLRVLVVDTDSERAKSLEAALTGLGHEVLRHNANQRVLSQSVRDMDPDIVLCDIDFPDRDVFEDMDVIKRDWPRPVVMFAQDSTRECVQQAIRSGVSAYVADGLKAERLQPIIEVAIARFEEIQGLRSELETTKAKLAERKTIERAKGMLMKARGMSEDEAFKTLRKLAMDKNKTLAEVCDSVITALEALG